MSITIVKLLRLISSGRRQESLFGIAFMLVLCRNTKNSFHQGLLKSFFVIVALNVLGSFHYKFRKCIPAILHLSKCLKTSGVKDRAEKVLGRACARYSVFDPLLLSSSCCCRATLPWYFLRGTFAKWLS